MSLLKEFIKTNQWSRQDLILFPIYTFHLLPL
jgi:hypothetical protein